MKYCTKNRNENWFEAQHVADLAKKKKTVMLGQKN